MSRSTETSKINSRWRSTSTVSARRLRRLQHSLSSADQNKDGLINRKDMIKIIEAMYDLANEEDRTGEKSPDKRVDLIMQRLNKEKDGTRGGQLRSEHSHGSSLQMLFYAMNSFKDACGMNFYVRFSRRTRLCSRENTPRRRRLIFP